MATLKHLSCVWNSLPTCLSANSSLSLALFPHVQYKHCTWKDTEFPSLPKGRHCRADAVGCWGQSANYCWPPQRALWLLLLYVCSTSQISTISLCLSPFLLTFHWLSFTVTQAVHISPQSAPTDLQNGNCGQSKQSRTKRLSTTTTVVAVLCFYCLHSLVYWCCQKKLRHSAATLILLPQKESFVCSNAYRQKCNANTRSEFFRLLPSELAHF